MVKGLVKQECRELNSLLIDSEKTMRVEADKSGQKIKSISTNRTVEGFQDRSTSFVRRAI